MKQPIIAKCYINQEGDERYFTYFTPHWLYINHQKQSWRFQNDHITDVGYDHHKLLIPLVLGGIMSSLSILILMRNLFDPFMTLIALLAGFGLIYYGWIGSSVLIIREGNSETKIYLNSITTNLKAYFSFYKSYIRTMEKEMNLYHIATLDDWDRPGEDYNHASLESEGFIHASGKSQVVRTFELFFPDSGNFVLLEIDPLKVNHEIKYELAPDRNETFPHIYGPLNKESVISALRFSDVSELRKLIM